MNHELELLKLILQNNGRITAREVSKAGLPHVYLTKLVRANVLERSARGVYIKADLFDDEMWSFQSQFPGSVYSHETALFLHRMSDRTPLFLSVTVPHGYNPSSLKAAGCKVYTIKPELFPLGLSKVLTPSGSLVRTYDTERSICDAYRSKSRMDISIVVQALQSYTRSKDSDISKLMKYAKLLRVDKPIHQALEVLL